VKFPGGARQNMVAKSIPLAPPAIPGPSKIIVRAFLSARQFIRQQPAQTEQSRLKLKRGTRAARPVGFGFGEMLHRPDVVLVTERPE